MSFRSPVSHVWAGVALACLLAWFACGPGERRDPRPDVLLITIDTLRADRLGSYGYALATSPEIDALGREGVVFLRGIAAATSTAPAHASIMTSRYTREHSIGWSNGGTQLRGGETLAERFRLAGYATAAFVGNIMLQPRTGFDRGFEVFDGELPDAETNRELVFERVADETTARALAWLFSTREKPVFLWVHYQDPHGPYTPPAAHQAAFPAAPTLEEPALPTLASDSGHGGIPGYQALEGLDRPSQYESRYAGEIHYADASIGRLLEAFETHRPGQSSIVLLTADHGESFGEQDHWFAHGFSTLPFLARVPFILRAPGIEPERRAETVSHVDILPTLLELSGLPAATDASGVALGPILRNEVPMPNRFVYSDIGKEASAYGPTGFVRITGVEDAWQPDSADGGTAEDRLWFHYDWPEASGPWRPKPAPGDDRPGAIVEYLDRATPMHSTPALELDHIERLRALGYTVD